MELALSQHQLPLGQESTGCWQGRGAEGRGWGSTKGQTLQETHLTGSQKPLHHCLSLFILSCLLTPAQLTWHSGKPNLIFQLREPSDLHCFQTDFIKESSMPSCLLEETQTLAKLRLRNREEKEHRSSPGYSMWVWPGMSQQGQPMGGPGCSSSPAQAGTGGCSPLSKMQSAPEWCWCWGPGASLVNCFGKAGKAGVAQPLGVQERWTNQMKRPLKYKEHPSIFFELLCTWY